MKSEGVLFRALKQRCVSVKGLFRIENCPNSKSIDEVIIENAFLEMFRLLTDNFDDVLDSVLQSVVKTLSSDGSEEKLKRINKEIDVLHSRRKKLTDMYLDDKINK